MSILQSPPPRVVSHPLMSPVAPYKIAKGLWKTVQVTIFAVERGQHRDQKQHIHIPGGGGGLVRACFGKAKFGEGKFWYKILDTVGNNTIRTKKKKSSSVTLPQAPKKKYTPRKPPPPPAW